MVDHVCMVEGSGKGRMCFCEEDMCNKSSPHFDSFHFYRYEFAMLILIYVVGLVIGGGGGV